MKIFEDHASGAPADRAGLRAALDYVRDGDVLIVWKLDRLGRELPAFERLTLNHRRPSTDRSGADYAASRPAPKFRNRAPQTEPWYCG